MYDLRKEERKIRTAWIARTVHNQARQKNQYDARPTDCETRAYVNHPYDVQPTKKEVLHTSYGVRPARQGIRTHGGDILYDKTSHSASQETNPYNLVRISASKGGRPYDQKTCIPYGHDPYNPLLAGVRTCREQLHKKIEGIYVEIRATRVEMSAELA